MKHDFLTAFLCCVVLCFLLPTTATSSSRLRQVSQMERGSGYDVYEDSRELTDNDDNMLEENGSGLEKVPDLVDEEKEDIGGGGIIIEPVDPIEEDITEPCKDQTFCINGGICYIYSSNRQQKHCQCPQSFKGDRCQLDDLISGDPTDPERVEQQQFNVFTHPLFITGVIIASVLFISMIALLVLLLLRLRKKDEGSYALSSDMRNNLIEYTKQPTSSSSEYYA